MDYNVNRIDTSLKLNSTNYEVFFDHMKRESQSNKDGIHQSKSTPKKEQGDALVEELNRANVENQRLTEMLALMYRNYNVLTNQMKEYVTKTYQINNSNNGSRKRKSHQNSITNHFNNGSNNSIGGGSSDEQKFSCKKAKGNLTKANISRVCVRTQTSDTSLQIVEDGYQWRKYGQKVTRDNPCPRAYFKCSFAPSCPVKKKVQRSNEDQCMLVAIYEGEHNHLHSSNLEGKQSASRSVTVCSTSYSSTKQTSMTLDPTKKRSQEDEVKFSNKKKVDSHGLQQFLVEQMVSSLTRDPSFREAIAKAMSSGRLLQPSYE